MTISTQSDSLIEASKIDCTSTFPHTLEKRGAMLLLHSSVYRGWFLCPVQNGREIHFVAIQPQTNEEFWSHPRLFYEDELEAIAAAQQYVDWHLLYEDLLQFCQEALADGKATPDMKHFLEDYMSKKRDILDCIE